MPGAGTFPRSLCAGLHTGLLSGPLPQLSHKIPKVKSKEEKRNANTEGEKRAQRLSSWEEPPRN